MLEGEKLDFFNKIIDLSIFILDIHGKKILSTSEIHRAFHIMFDKNNEKIEEFFAECSKALTIYISSDEYIDRGDNHIYENFKEKYGDAMKYITKLLKRKNKKIRRTVPAYLSNALLNIANDDLTTDMDMTNNKTFDNIVRISMYCHKLYNEYKIITPDMLKISLGILFGDNIIHDKCMSSIDEFSRTKITQLKHYGDVQKIAEKYKLKISKKTMMYLCTLYENIIQ